MVLDALPKVTALAAVLIVPARFIVDCVIAFKPPWNINTSAI